MRFQPADSSDAAEQPVLHVTFDDGHLFDKYRTRVLLYESRKLAGAAARDSIQKALQLDPKNAAAHNHLAWLLATGAQEVRDPQQAVGHARQAVAINGELPTYHNTLGVALYRAGEFAESTSMLKHSLEQTTGPATAYDLVFLALCYVKFEDWTRANDCYSQALAVFDANANRLSALEKTELTGFLNEAKAVGLPRN